MSIETNSMIPVQRTTYHGSDLVLGYADQVLWASYEDLAIYASVYTSEAGSKALKIKKKIKDSDMTSWWSFVGINDYVVLNNSIYNTEPNRCALRRTIVTNKIHNSNLYKIIVYSNTDEIVSNYRQIIFSDVMKRISDNKLRCLNISDLPYWNSRTFLYVKFSEVFPYFKEQFSFNKENDPYHSKLQSALSGSIYNRHMNEAVANYIKMNESFKDRIFEILKKVCPFPFSRGWIDYIVGEKCITLEPCRAKYADIENSENVYAIIFRFSVKDIFRKVKEGLSLGRININSNASGVNQNGNVPDNLSEYLEKYSEELVGKINCKFTPLFSPVSDKFTEKEKDYFEYAKSFSGINFYTAQKNIIASISRSIKKNGNSIIVGEMGVGKTAMSIGSLYIFEKKKNPFNIVMAPGHLVEKWKREIENLYPGSVAYIIDSLTTLQKLDSKIRDKKRKYPLFLIISKDTAKISYAFQPIPKYDKHKHHFICPHCGQPSYEYTKKIYGCSYKHEDLALSYASKNDQNSTCYTCGAPMWGSACNDNSAWVKLKNGKFVNMDAYEDLSFHINDQNSRIQDIYREMSDIKENGTPVMVSPRRYPIAKYIKNRYKGLIDTFIADEVHLYSSSQSYQSEAFGDIVKAAKRTVALTGTLLNGYSSSIYHILFRMYPRLFVEKGYTYSSVSKFADDFGSICTTVTTSTFPNIRPKKSKKIAPGVSPRIFTDFLLDKSVFVSLSDMNAEMAHYKEVPVAVDLTSEEREEYNKIMKQIKERIESNTSNRFDSVFQMIQRTNMYLDQPFDAPPIVSPEGETLLKYKNLFDDEKLKEDYTSAKDEKLFEIAKEKIDKGENVLIYVNYVNSTNCVKRLKKMFDLAGIPTFVLTSSIAAKDREKWIDDAVKGGCRILICNPSLVETGLDLLAFTNIIFYQMGYNLFTMRQASRRSLRLNQTNNVTVYFLYFKDTIQESVLSLMASKLQASMAIEGKFSKEGLNELTNNDSILTQVANSIVKNIEHKIDEGTFKTELTSPDTDFKLINMIESKEVESYSSIFLKKRSKNIINLNRFICDYNSVAS